VPNVEAARELLAPLDDVWAFVSDPYNLPRWWPRLAGVEPDRRGLAPGARWVVQGESRPSFVRRPEAVGALIVREVEPRRLIAFHLTGDRLDVQLRLEESAPDRTLAELKIHGPWLVGLSPRLPRQALGRLYSLVQTAAT
jgi:uncharacterized protein YndB with AHSA1/START domain